jgi:hypothetical protein
MKYFVNTNSQFAVKCLHDMLANNGNFISGDPLNYVLDGGLI